MKIIKPKCPNCGHEVQIRLIIIDRLESKIKELEEELSHYKISSTGEDSNVEYLKNIFGMD